MVDYTRIPEHMQGSARAYIEDGVRPGRFLTAVICNDLFGAIGSADDINRAAIVDWCAFFYNEAPGSCWGSPDAMEYWIERKSQEVA